MTNGERDNQRTRDKRPNLHEEMRNASKARRGVIANWVRNALMEAATGSILLFRQDLPGRVDGVDDDAQGYLRATSRQRQPRDNGQGKADESLGASVLWADIDAYGEAREQALLALRALPQPPTLIASSGRGLQAWWA